MFNQFEHLYMGATAPVVAARVRTVVATVAWCGPGAPYTGGGRDWTPV